MKRLLLILISCGMLCGCASSAGDYCQHVWDFRDTFIYDNPNLTSDDVEAEICALGAVLELSPETVEEDLTDHEEDDPESSTGAK